MLLDPFRCWIFLRQLIVRASIKTLLLRFCANFRRMKAHSPRVAQNDLWMKNSSKLGNRSAQLFYGLVHLFSFLASQTLFSWLLEMQFRLLCSPFSQTIIYAPCLPPKILHFVSSFSWILQESKEKLKAMVLQNLGGRQGALWSRWKMVNN